jgi:two-component system response regulator ResD
VIRPRVVLIVERDQQIRSRLTGYVADDLGLPVAVARDANEALARAYAARPDVVLIDLTMPGGAGFAVARQLRGGALGRGAWIVGVTAWPDPRSAFDAGCDEVLVQPFDLAMVRPARRVVGGPHAAGRALRRPIGAGARRGGIRPAAGAPGVRPG